MPNWKKVVVSGSAANLSSLHVDTSVTASIFSGSEFIGNLSGTASQAISSSYALTASYIEMLPTIVTGSNATFVQPTPASTWIFAHNLNDQYPVFQVFNASNEVIIPTSITANNTTTATITFSVPTAGTAVASIGGYTGSTTTPSASFASTASFAFTASYALNVPDTASFAVSASHAILSDNAISSSYAATASSADQFNIRTALTASGLNYPTIDGLEGQIVQTDGAGNLFFNDIETIYEPVRNGEAFTLVKGTPVYVSGSLGANPIVYAADAAIPAKMPVTYIISEDILSNEVGRGILLGLITGIDLTGYTAGTEVYVAAGGGWTSTRPTGSAVVQILGIITKPGSGGQGIVLNPGPVNLPNIQSGYTWVGDSNGVPQAVVTSSIRNVVSSSYASFAQAIPTNLNLTASNLLVYNNITASSISAISASFGYIQTVTGSAVIIGNEYIVLNTQAPAARYAGMLIYDSGSFTTASIVWDSETNHFVYSNGSGSSYSGGGFLAGPKNTGSLADITYPTLNRVVRSQGDDHLYDSNISDDDSKVAISIPLVVTGSVIASSFTGSLFGTASWASNAVSASHSNTSNVSITSSYAVSASVAETSSYALTASYFITSSVTSASFATSASLAQTASFVTTAQTASYVLNAVSSSRTVTSSFAFSASVAVSSSFATTSSFAQTSSFAATASSVNTLNQAVVISGSLGIAGNSGTTIFSSNADTLIFSGSAQFTGSFGVTGSLNVTQGITGSLSGSALTAISASFASTASYVSNAVSSSFALTASYALNAGSGGGATTGSNTFYGDQAISGSISATGSIAGNVILTPTTASNVIVSAGFNGMLISPVQLQGSSSVAIGSNLIIL